MEFSDDRMLNYENYRRKIKIELLEDGKQNYEKRRKIIIMYWNSLKIENNTTKRKERQQIWNKILRRCKSHLQ